MPGPDLVLVLGLDAPPSWEERAQVVEISGPDQAEGWRRLLPSRAGVLGQLLSRCTEGLDDGGRVAVVAYGHATALVGQLLLDPQADQLDAVLVFAGHPLGQAEGWRRFAQRAAAGRALLGFWVPGPSTTVGRLVHALPRQCPTPPTDLEALWAGPPNEHEWVAQEDGPTWTRLPLEQWEQRGSAFVWQAEAEGEAGRWFARHVAPELVGRAVLWPRWGGAFGARWARPVEPAPSFDPAAPLQVDELQVDELQVDEGGAQMERLARKGRQVLREASGVVREASGVVREASGLVSAFRRVRDAWRG